MVCTTIQFAVDAPRQSVPPGTASRITSIRREAGKVIYYGYDDADRLTGERWYESDLTPLYAFESDYDGAGNDTDEQEHPIITYKAPSGRIRRYFPYEAVLLQVKEVFLF